MAHAKPGDLEDLKHLLDEVRAIDFLKEKSIGCFYRKSKSVLHFHVKDERRFAHVFDGANWHELDIKPNPSLAAQKILVKSIRNLLPGSRGSQKKIVRYK